MDFTKFVSLLEKSALFFARLDLLAKSDPMEGSLSMHDANQIDSLMKLKWPSFPPEIWAANGYPDEKSLLIRQNIEKFSLLNIMIARRFFANCWRISEFQSDAMWKTYCDARNGIAVVSNVQKLTSAFSSFAENIYVGQIKYLDYKKVNIPHGNVFNLALHKRLEYESEQELRAIFFDSEDPEISKVMEGVTKPYADIKSEISIAHLKPMENSGRFVNVDLNTLIDRIVVGPAADQTFVDLVKSVAKKYGVSKSVERSDLYQGIA
jgi:hypothetical protein